jgi:hypothetical protein
LRSVMIPLSRARPCGHGLAGAGRSGPPTAAAGRRAEGGIASSWTGTSPSQQTHRPGLRTGLAGTARRSRPRRPCGPPAPPRPRALDSYLPPHVAKLARKIAEVLEMPQPATA